MEARLWGGKRSQQHATLCWLRRGVSARSREVWHDHHQEIFCRLVRLQCHVWRRAHGAHTGGSRRAPTVARRGENAVPPLLHFRANARLLARRKHRAAAHGPARPARGCAQGTLCALRAQHHQVGLQRCALEQLADTPCAARPSRPAARHRATAERARGLVRGHQRANRVPLCPPQQLRARRCGQSRVAARAGAILRSLSPGLPLGAAKREQARCNKPP